MAAHKHKLYIQKQASRGTTMYFWCGLCYKTLVIPKGVVHEITQGHVDWQHAPLVKHLMEKALDR